MKSLASGASVRGLGSNFTDQPGSTHFADEVKGMNVRTQPDIDATRPIVREMMQVRATPRQRHGTVGHIGTRGGDTLVRSCPSG